MNEDILNFFTKKIGFKWVSIENITGKVRRKKLCYRNNELENIQGENYIGNINIESMSLLSFIKKDDTSIEKINNIINFKYMNIFQIYALLSGQKDLLFSDFKDNNHRLDPAKFLSKESPIFIWFLPENKNFEDLKFELKDNKSIIDIIEKSNIYKDRNNSLYFSFSKLELNIFFKNILNVSINEYNYFRISSHGIEIIEDKDNDYIFYNIPTFNKVINILIFELGNKMKNLLINNELNIYDVLLDYFNKSSNEAKNNKEILNIYIPSFDLESKYFTDNYSSDLNNIDIFENINEGEKISLKIKNIEEYSKTFLKKSDIFYKNQIKYNLNNAIDNNENKDIIINDDFIIAIMNNYIDINSPLFHLVYVPKKYWTKNI
jgi:hypothetical protein